MWSNAVVLIDITLIPRKCGLNSIQEPRKCGRAVVTLTDCPPLWDWEQQRVPHHIAPNCHIAHCTLRATPPCATLHSAHHGATAKLHKTTTVHTHKVQPNLAQTTTVHQIVHISLYNTCKAKQNCVAQNVVDQMQNITMHTASPAPHSTKQPHCM